MYLYELNNRADFYSKHLFDLYYDSQIKLNNRLKRTLAWFIPNTKEIEFGKQALNCNNELIIDDILIHELTHWYLHENELPYDDGDMEFENSLKALGISSTDMYYVEGDKAYTYEKIHYRYCSICGKREKVSQEVYYLEVFNDTKMYCCDKPMWGDIDSVRVEWRPSKQLVELNRLYNKIKNAVGKR